MVGGWWEEQGGEEQGEDQDGEGYMLRLGRGRELAIMVLLRSDSLSLNNLLRLAPAK